MKIDYSTINPAVIAKMKPYVKPPSYHVSDSMGSACAGDPPGYPSYFIRHIYTRSGNSPAKGCTSVIEYNKRYYELEQADSSYEALEKKLRRLWLPLPADHPRTIAWMADTYKHHQHCYINPAITDKNNRDRMVIYPVGKWQLPVFRDDKRYSKAWRKAAQMEHYLATYETILAAVMVADPENHSAVQIIRRYYPDHKPNLAWIKTPPATSGNWWEFFSYRPTPENCPGEIAWSKSAGYSTKHPINGSWCQVCGWSQAEEAKLIARKLAKEHSHMRYVPKTCWLCSGYGEVDCPCCQDELGCTCNDTDQNDNDLPGICNRCDGDAMVTCPICYGESA